jgi:prevent-host-death family protein
MSAEPITSTEFQRTCGTVADRVRGDQQTFIVTSHGRPQMVLMPYARYVQLTGDEAIPTPEPITLASCLRHCEICGTTIPGAGPGRRFCSACQPEAKRVRSAEYMRAMRARRRAERQRAS